MMKRPTPKNAIHLSAIQLKRTIPKNLSWTTTRLHLSIDSPDYEAQIDMEIWGDIDQVGGGEEKEPPQQDGTGRTAGGRESCGRG